MKIFRLIFIFLMLFTITNAQWQKQNVDTKASLRGLSVVNSNVIWASGSSGTVLRTVDGGKNWQVIKVPDAEKLDFRDIEAFDTETAYILSIGEGESSRIYKTIDGGKTWQLKLKVENPKVFLDAFAFWDSRSGIVMSDPVDGKFLIYLTYDGWETKQKVSEKIPMATDGEAAFAASGTCLIIQGRSNVFLVSGGNNARVFQSKSVQLFNDWTVSDTPFVKGTAGSGIFSIAMRDAKNGVIVGGNYEKPNDITNNLAFTKDGGKTWELSKGLSGYRSGVTYVDKKTILAVGSSGSDLTTDGGKTWTNLDKENYNAVQAKSKNAIWAVGAGGLVSKFSMK